MNRKAFTLVELLVVIAIIGLLSSVAVVALSGSKVSANNAKRKADIVQISKALELYNSDNGVYPSTGGSANWRGACTNFSSYPDSGAGAWIPNFQNYMGLLPHDPATNKVVSQNAACIASPLSSCYIYTSNGTDYKVLAHCTAEGPSANISSDPLSDPGSGGGRATHSYSVYSPGAKAW